MNKSIRGTTKKRGRPVTTGKGTQVGTRWQDVHLKQIEDWRRKQDDKPPRSEAIRRLVEMGLSKTSERRHVFSKQSAARAAEMAAKTIEKHLDPNAPAEEREVRKRKLLQGPSVFRDARKDR
jgi:hypothetical protein